MLSVYQNLRKDRTFRTEKFGDNFAVVEINKRGKYRLAVYPTRADAERALKVFAREGFRWVGYQSES